MKDSTNRYTVQLLSDPVEVARAAERDRQFRRNLDWWQQNAVRIGREQRGRCIAIAGRELFAADSAASAIAQARAAHPEDAGIFVHFIPSHSHPRNYAH